MNNQSELSEFKKNRQLRREKVHDLHIQGLSARAIAIKLGVPRTTIRRDLAYFQRQYREAFPHDGIRTLAEDLDRLRLLESEAWKAWQRSQQPLTIEKTTIEEGGERPKTKLEKTVTSQVGDRHYLDMVSQAVLRRCQLAIHQPKGMHHGQPFLVQFEKISQTRNHFAEAVVRGGIVGSFADLLASIVREDSQPRTLETRPASGAVGPGDHGPGAGSPSEIDRADAAETWEI